MPTGDDSAIVCPGAEVRSDLTPSGQRVDHLGCAPDWYRQTGIWPRFFVCGRATERDPGGNQTMVDRWFLVCKGERA